MLMTAKESLADRKASRVAAAAVTGSVIVQLALATPAVALPPPAGSVVKAPAVEVAAVNPGRLIAGPTSWPALNRAIASIPNYRRGVASWVVDSAYGHYGATNLSTRQIHIARRVPTSRLFSVAAHEYAHALTAANYAGKQRAVNAALARYFRAGTVMNREYSADCMAVLMGARWTYYTKCSNARWRYAAATLLRGGRL